MHGTYFTWLDIGDINVKKVDSPGSHIFVLVISVEIKVARQWWWTTMLLFWQPQPLCPPFHHDIIYAVSFNLDAATFIYKHDWISVFHIATSSISNLTIHNEIIINNLLIWIFCGIMVWKHDISYGLSITNLKYWKTVPFCNSGHKCHSSQIVFYTHVT